MRKRIFPLQVKASSLPLAVVTAVLKAGRSRFFFIHQTRPAMPNALFPPATPEMSKKRISLTPETTEMDYTYVDNIVAHTAGLAKAEHPTEHVHGRAVHTDDHLKVLTFQFEAGQALEEHTTPHPAVLHFLEGEADVTLGNDAVEVQAGTWIHMPPRLPHSIHARTQVLMLLLVLRSVR